MVILLVFLTLREPAVGSRAVRAAEVLLRHLQLFFVPAGVGVVQYLSLIAASAVPLVAGLFLSWVPAARAAAAGGGGVAALAPTAAVAGVLAAASARRRSVPR